MNASVEQMYMVGEHGGEPKRIDCAEAVAETGLRGDRHFGSEGSDLTLIARFRTRVRPRRSLPAQ